MYICFVLGHLYIVHKLGLCALTSDTLSKLRHLQNLYFAGENSFTTIVNKQSVLKLLQFSNGDLFSCSMPKASTKCKNLE